jgi:hypothetical protein
MRTEAQPSPLANSNPFLLQFLDSTNPGVAAAWTLVSFNPN